MGHNGCDGSQASGPWAIGSGYRFNICIYVYIYIYIVIVIVITTYHAVYWSYRASRADRWFLPRSIPLVPGLPEVAHCMTEDPEGQGYRSTMLLGQWHLQSVSISNGEGRWPVRSPGLRGQGTATQQQCNKQKARASPSGAKRQPRIKAACMRRKKGRTLRFSRTPTTVVTSTTRDPT